MRFDLFLIQIVEMSLGETVQSLRVKFIHMKMRCLATLSNRNSEPPLPADRAVLFPYLP